nr:v-type proton atpase subunit c [Quercus suber]
MFFQVPRSSKKLYEDNEYALYTVTLFGRVADNFRTAACERGFQIRDFEYSPEAQESRKQDANWKTEDEAGGGVAGLAGDADAHPYVSFIINLI